MNTRRFPRTMQDAFKGADYATAIEGPDRSYPKHWWRCFIAISLAGLVVVGCT